MDELAELVKEAQAGGLTSVNKSSVARAAGDYSKFVSLAQKAKEPPSRVALLMAGCGMFCLKNSSGNNRRWVCAYRQQSARARALRSSVAALIRPAMHPTPNMPPDCTSITQNSKKSNSER